MLRVKFYKITNNNNIRHDKYNNNKKIKMKIINIKNIYNKYK